MGENYLTELLRKNVGEQRKKKNDMFINGMFDQELRRNTVR